jgi:hypothetical protein
MVSLTDQRDPPETATALPDDALTAVDDELTLDEDVELEAAEVVAEVDVEALALVACVADDEVPGTV